ncbi:MAG: P-type conjugative transfer protein TrbL [Thiobacillaceae bacterium]
MNPSIFLVIVLMFLGMAEPALAANTLDQIQSNFQSASSGWMSAALPYANHLFGGLAALEFSWAGVQYLLRKNDLPEFLSSVTLKLVSLGFFYTLLTLAPSWIPLIISSFTQAGAAVSGTAAMTPSGVFDLGPQVASLIIQVLGTPSVTSGLSGLGSYFFAAIAAGLSGLLVVIAFALAALQLLMTLIESYIVIGGGALMLGFLGSRWTLPFGEKYFGYAISVGIKLFILYLIIGMGPTLANAIISDLNTAAAAAGSSTPPPAAFLTAAASSLIYGALAFMVPGLAGSLMNGTPAMSLGNMGGAGAMIAGGMVGAGAAGLSTSARMANGTIGAAKSFGSLGALARDQGLGSALRTGGGAMGAMAMDAVKGISGQSNRMIASNLGDSAVSGWGAGSSGGNLANRIRLGGALNTALPEVDQAVTSAATHSSSQAAPSNSTGGVAASGSSTVVSDVKATNEADGFTGGASGLTTQVAAQGMTSNMNPGASDANRVADRLDRLADRNLPRNLPHDGHAGGISIRLNHSE